MERPGEETLIRYFLGQCSPDEEKVVNAYLALKIDQDYIEACLREAFYMQEDGYNPTKDQQERDRVWNKLLTRQQETPVIRLKPRRLWYRYAAAVAFLILTGSIIFLLNGKWGNNSQQVIAWTQLHGEIGKPKTITLADSSVVTLFPGSVIDIPSNFNQTDRKIKLSGRAFFRIAHNRKKPFYVRAKELTTKVLGTSFEVNSTETENIITLRTGKVSVLRSDKEIARLIPNQQIKYQQTTGKYNVAPVDASRTLNWIHGELDYERVPLNDVMHDIEKWYGVKVQINSQSLADQKVIFSFKDQSLNRVLSLLSKSADFSYEIKGKHVILKERNMDTN